MKFLKLGEQIRNLIELLEDCKIRSTSLFGDILWKVLYDLSADELCDEMEKTMFRNLKKTPITPFRGLFIPLSTKKGAQFAVGSESKNSPRSNEVRKMNREYIRVRRKGPAVQKKERLSQANILRYVKNTPNYKILEKLETSQKYSKRRVLAPASKKRNIDGKYRKYH